MAGTIDPAIEASTCALGNQRCSPYRGIFTINDIMHASQRKILDQVAEIGLAQC